ncbi:MAG: Clp protease N-terminal domain-containing protein [Eisenbergiella sp.]
MQSQFTDKAKTALLLAGRAAKSLHQNYAGTEHILLGLIREENRRGGKGADGKRAKEEAIREMIQRSARRRRRPHPRMERDGYSPAGRRFWRGEPQTGGKRQGQSR